LGETYQRPREKKPSSKSTSTTIKMIQRIDTWEPPSSVVVRGATDDRLEGVRGCLTQA
jgi:hypothetical protein